MAELALCGLAVAAITAPHSLRLDRVAPVMAAAVWLLALLLRALLAVGLVLFWIADLHGADPVFTVEEWHLQHLLSALGDALDVAVHPTAHVLALIPLLAILIPLTVAAIDLARGWLLLRSTLAAASGDGPLGTTLVPDRRVLVAVAGLGRGRILISRGALDGLDRAELAAAVAHERGHIRRAHRPLLLLASFLAALAWMLPGTRSARRHFVASLECDADDYAVRETGDRLALAAAICKAARTAPIMTPSLQGTGAVTLRLQRLLADDPPPGVVLEHSVRPLIVLLGLVAAIFAEFLLSIALFGSDLGHMLNFTGHGGEH